MNSWFGLLQKSTLTAGFGSLPRRMHEHTDRHTHIHTLTRSHAIYTHTYNKHTHTHTHVSKLSQLVGHYDKAAVVVAVNACHECPVADKNKNSNSNT